MPTGGPLSPNDDTEEEFPRKCIVDPSIPLEIALKGIKNEQSGHDL
jgi:hypothetical protein